VLGFLLGYAMEKTVLENPLVVASGLSKVFPDRKGKKIIAVDGIDFECRGGRIFGLLGPNGAGKTTTLRMLSTILRPSGGTATICGFDVGDQPEEVRSRIGFLTGTTGLYGRLTPREMVTYYARLNGMRDAETRTRVAELFDLLDMNEFADRKNDNLSTGMKQRVSLARSIVHDPPVMIFDEPTAGLDILSSRAIIAFINTCKDEGKCVIFSTHILHEAQRLCDEVAIIHKGKLLAQGPIEELQQQSGREDLEDIFIDLVEEKS
jgi:sodium transport system ATP-binding protein